ncbi:hypothetical protein [Candidatus Puniceispirillum sp.]
MSGVHEWSLRGGCLRGGRQEGGDQDRPSAAHDVGKARGWQS